MTPDGLEKLLRDMGAQRYHNLHPFHVRMRNGECTRGQIEAWALNRFVYQAAIPRKDATLIARCHDPDVRRAWRQRLEDHDGHARDDGDGGLTRWLKLTDGLGLDREAVVSQRLALPATRFAAEAYVHFVGERSLLAAVASSLTELFSPTIIPERTAAMLAHYPFITPDILGYFDHRAGQAGADSKFALDYVLRHANSDETRAEVVDALSFKFDVLWTMMDALEHAYVTPGLIPPGCFIPGDRGG